jgi:hypothetical protein
LSFAPRVAKLDRVDPDDVTSIIEGLFDIRTEVRRIVAILGGEDDDEEGDQETDS